jgi:hypothetical protein
MQLQVGRCDYYQNYNSVDNAIGSMASEFGLSAKVTEDAMKAALIIAGILTVLAMPIVADAQGIIGGAEQGAKQGAKAGSKAAGPVGGAVGTAVGGTVGGVTGGVKGAIGAPAKPAPKSKSDAK